MTIGSTHMTQATNTSPEDNLGTESFLEVAFKVATNQICIMKREK